LAAAAVVVAADETEEHAQEQVEEGLFEGADSSFETVAGVAAGVSVAK
jgi:hypothetical protein